MNYRGFSTFGSRKHLQLASTALVKRDLLNHIYTLKGERVMMPGFGTRIPLIAFEPLDALTLKDIEDDLRTVVAYDPRVNLVDIAVMALPANNAVVAVLDLQYVEGPTYETLRLEFAAA